jgi:hypothetical protein
MSESRYLVLLFTLLLSACAAPPEPPQAEPEPAASEVPEVARDPVVIYLPTPEPAPPVPLIVPKQDEVSELVTEFQRLRKLPVAELVREQEAARLGLAQTRSDRSRVRLAMTLAVPGSAANDETRALELLDAVVKNPAADLAPLASLLSAYIGEQRRLLAQVQGLNQNVAGLQQNVQSLQGNVQALQQKLDALKTLERTLTERRPAGAPVRR